MSYPIKSLWEVCIKITDWTHSTPKYIEKWVHFLSVKDITKWFINFSNTRYISQEEHEKLIKRCNPEYWDILYTKVWTIWYAKSIDVKKDFSIFVSLALLKFDKKIITTNFLEYVLNSKDVYNQAQNWTKWVTNKNLVLRDIKTIQIPLPPLPTQKLIVQKLDSAFKNIDESIKITKKNIDNIEELNKSVLKWIFEKWNYNKIELSKITTLVWWWTPRTNISEYWWNDIIWLSPTDLPKIWEIVNVSNSLKKISKLWLEKSSAKLLPIWTVIYSSRATIWKIAINNVEVSTNQGFANFICSEKIYNYFLAYALKNFTDDIIWLSNSTTFKEVNKTNFKNYKIPLPPLPKQKEIVEYLDKIFEKNKILKENYEEKLKNLQEMKQSVLKEAFENEEFVDKN